MKRNWLQKGIVSLIMIGIFLAPVSGGVKINEARAQAVTVTISANPTSVLTGAGSTITWSSTNATSCTGSDKLAGWVSSPSGTFLTGNITSNSTYTITCTKGTDQVSKSVTVTVTTPTIDNTNTSYFDCSGILPWTDITCKAAAFLYFVIFTPMAAFTWLAAKILDFFVYYATNSSSYNGEFINKAWGAVRDIANIFFIITLLYIALKTILGLNVTDNKKLISAVIIIALVINFSLFATKIVIDASNILAKVFYNNITSVDETGKTLGPGAGGQKSVSVGLVKQFDPQTIIGNEFKEHQGLFIFVTLLSIILMGFIIYIFLSIALLFVTRVVSLWISMIFSPIAFVSYGAHFDIPGFGYKEWWKTLIESAFLAPIFIFFLYVIILFGDAMKNIPYDVGSTASDVGGYLDATMKTVIPFILIFILLKMAKDLAVKYSGKAGEAMAKIGSAAGGLALGAITGGAALAGRTVIGGGGGYLAGQAAKGADKIGLKRTASSLRDIGTFAQKSSFDVRGVKVAGQSLGSVTGIKIGEAQKGGWSEMKKKQVEKRQKRADELEKRGTGTEKKNVELAEIDLKEKTLPVRLDLAEADKEIEKTRIALNDIKGTGDKAGTDAAIEKLRDAQDAKDKIRGIDTTIGGIDPKTGYKIRIKLTPKTGSIAEADKNVREAKQALDVKGETITKEYAEKISSQTSKNLNSIFRLGAYSRAGADEAARKIKTGTKFDSGEKPK